MSSPDRDIAAGIQADVAARARVERRDYTTVGELAGYFRVSTSLIVRYCKEGRLAGATRIGRTLGWRIPVTSIAEFVRQRERETARPRPPVLPDLSPRLRPTEGPATRTGYVYFIRAGESGPIKIGISLKAPHKRLATLQTSHHEELRLLGKSRGRLEDERALHRRFAHLHIRGEWFRPEPDLLEFIAALPPSFRPPKRVKLTVEEHGE